MTCFFAVARFRYIAICRPLRAKALNTVRRARRIILCLWTAGVAYCCPWLALATTQPTCLDDGRNISICTLTLPNYEYLYVVYYAADLVIFYAAPLLTAVVLYILIARTLYAAVGCPGVAEGGRASNPSIVSMGDVSGTGEPFDVRRESSISITSVSVVQSRIRVRQRLPGLVIN